MPGYVVVVEDELILQEFISIHFEKMGFSVACATSAEQARALVRERTPDLILLDLGLPDEDGLVLARQLRTRSAVPIIVLTASDDAATRIACYEAGVDDYINKGVVAQELVLRVQNVLRRNGRKVEALNSESEDDQITVNGWIIDLAGNVVRTKSGEIIDLTAMEFRVLSSLARAKNRILSRAQLLDAISDGTDPPTERTVDAFVSRIRRKLGEKCPIVTVKGLGYRFDAGRASG